MPSCLPGKLEPRRWRALALAIAITVHAGSAFGLWLDSSLSIAKLPPPPGRAAVAAIGHPGPRPQATRHSGAPATGRSSPRALQRARRPARQVAAPAALPTTTAAATMPAPAAIDLAPAAIDLGPAESDPGPGGYGTDAAGVGGGESPVRGAVPGGPWPIDDYSAFRSPLVTDRDRGRQIWLELDIDEGGRVESVRVVRSVSPAIDDEARAIAGAFVFHPRISADGRPVRSTITWKFTLR